MSQRLLYGDLRGSGEALGDSLAMLKSYLMRPPVEVSLHIEPIHSCDLEAVAEIRDVESIQDLTGRVFDLLWEMYDHCDPSIILCDEGGFISQLALRAAPHAVWGATNGWIAYVYGAFHREAVWHEVLHILGAEDCYDRQNPKQNPGPTCELDNCIIQYAPTKSAIGPWPFICTENVQRIRSRDDAGSTQRG